MIVRYDDSDRGGGHPGGVSDIDIRTSARIRKTLTALIYALTVFWAMSGPATSAEIVTLDGPVPSPALVGKIDYYLDEDWSRTVADMLGDDADRFTPLAEEVASFGYTKSMVWLRLRLRNVAENESRWILYFRENFKQVFEVYVAHADGRIETAIRQSVETGFDTRPIDYPELAAPFDLAAGAEATVLVRYWSEGASYLPVQIETPTSFSAISAARSAKNYLYYGMMLLLIAGALVALAIFRHAVFLAYICYSTSMLIFLAHADGVAFQHIWPGWPGFNSIASIVTGSGLIAFGAIYARIFLRTRELHPILDKLLLAVLAGVLAIDVSAFFLDNQAIKRLLVLVALAALLLFTAAGIVAARTRFKEVRFFVFAWAGAALSSLLMTARHWFDVDVSQDFQYDSMRIVMVFDATMMGLAIIDSYNQLRTSRQRALTVGLAQARQNLELSGRLQELERQFSLADELARSQGDALKDTIHDLRQPLNALRLRIHSILNDDTDPEDSRQDIQAAFEYLETLVNERLTGDAPTPTPVAADDGVSLGQTLASIHQMFRPDAEAKGLELRLAPTAAEANVSPLALMRVVSNLVANAIKYTEQGGVLLGARHAGDAIRIEVHDTGPGLTAEEFERVQGRKIRLEEGARLAEGHGLGLAIARQIADEQGWSLTLCPRRKTGTGVILTLGDG